MPLLLIVVFVIVLSVAFFALLVPLSILQRFRAGTARRRARWWVLSLNLFAAVISSALLLGSAALSNLWIPGAFLYTAGGLAGGCLLGAAGLLATRIERAPGVLHYTPNRILILLITTVVSARIFYGFWRGWQAWQASGGTADWLARSGAAGSLAAGAVVLGYYLVYWIGLRFRLNRHMSG